MEHEECTADEADEGCGVVPVQFVSKVVDGKDSEDREGNDLLDNLELRGGKGVRADAIGGHLEAVLKESYGPGDDDHLPQRGVAVLEVTIPGEGHEDVGADEKKDCPHIKRVDAGKQECRCCETALG